jgi:osmotically-inducible protein OsmY
MRFFSLALLLVFVGAPCMGAQLEEIDDQDITQFVTTKLQTDEAMEANVINVETADGVVTLTGSTDNLLEKERAAEIARSVKGVRDVVNRITVRPCDRDDLEIQKDVAEALRSDPATEPMEVSATVTDGTVTIDGTVGSWAEKELCSEVVKAVRGVRDVENNVEVAFAERRRDDEIKTEIQRRLRSDVWVDSRDIDVQVKDGRVTLAGAAGSAAEKARAYLDAFVSGVSEVDDGALNVEWSSQYSTKSGAETPPAVSDEDIKEDIRGAFLRDPRVLVFNPEIQVNDGAVVLSGVVGDLAAKYAAEQDALAIVGVWSVDNRLKVRPEDMPEDSAIAEWVTNALHRDPYTDAYQIDVTVTNGLVDLQGTVNSRFEREEASRVASKVKGVLEISNNLDVRYERELARAHGDQELKEDIETALWWSVHVPSEDIAVTVDRGVATLAGAVDTWNQRRVAEETAREAGASTVVDKLEVRLFGPDYSKE